MSWRKKHRDFTTGIMKILLHDNEYKVYPCEETVAKEFKLLLCASRSNSKIGVYAVERRRKVGDKQSDGASFLPSGEKGSLPGNLLERIEFACKRLGATPYIGLAVVQMEYSKVISFLGEMETILRINDFDRSDNSSRCQIRIRQREIDLYSSSKEVIYGEYPIDVGNELFRRCGGFES